MSEQLPSETVSTAATKIADEMHRQLNFARDRARMRRQSAVGLFQMGDIVKAYKALGEAEGIENMVSEFNALRLRIGDGDYDV